MEWLLYRRWRRMLWARVKGPEVLEVGVGTGRNLPYYPEGVCVTGIDFSPRMLERACRRLQRFPHVCAAFYVMDVQHLDFADNTFDEAVSTFVFCSVPDPVRGMREVLRVVRPGGTFFLLEHMVAYHPFPARLMERLDAPIYRRTGVHIARDTVGNLRKAGWEVITEQPLALNGIFRYLEARKLTGAQ